MIKTIRHIPTLLLTNGLAKRPVKTPFPASPNSAQIVEGWTMSLLSKLRNPMGSFLWLHPIVNYKHVALKERGSNLPLLDHSFHIFIPSTSTACTFLAASLTQGHLCFMLKNNFAKLDSVAMSTVELSQLEFKRAFLTGLCGLLLHEKAVLGLPFSQQLQRVPRRKRVRTEVLQAKNTLPDFQNSSHKAFHSDLFCPSDSPRKKTHAPVILPSLLFTHRNPVFRITFLSSEIHYEHNNVKRTLWEVIYQTWARSFPKLFTTNTLDRSIWPS